MNKKELGIYVHIPFCKQKCYYCDFISYSNKYNEIPQYIESLIKEIEAFDFENYNVTTIYIGGGTPSYIDSKYIKQILAKIKEKTTNCCIRGDIMPKFSIIIPVYNVEEYIGSCLESVKNQTFKDYEVIKGKMDDVFLNATGIKLGGE